MLRKENASNDEARSALRAARAVLAEQYRLWRDRPLQVILDSLPEGRAAEVLGSGHMDPQVSRLWSGNDVLPAWCMGELVRAARKRRLGHICKWRVALV